MCTSRHLFVVNVSTKTKYQYRCRGSTARQTVTPHVAFLIGLRNWIGSDWNGSEWIGFTVMDFYDIVCSHCLESYCTINQSTNKINQLTMNQAKQPNPNKPTNNQPNQQSTNHNQPMNPPNQTNQPLMIIKQTIDRPTKYPTNQPTSYQPNQPINKPTNRPINQ